jgi:hypothetical protein
MKFIHTQNNWYVQFVHTVLSVQCIIHSAIEVCHMFCIYKAIGHGRGRPLPPSLLYTVDTGFRDVAPMYNTAMALVYVHVQFPAIKANVWLKIN